MKGRCQNGDNCEYRHSGSQQASVAGSAGATPPTTPRSQTAPDPNSKRSLKKALAAAKAKAKASPGKGYMAVERHSIGSLALGFMALAAATGVGEVSGAEVPGPAFMAES